MSYAFANPSLTQAGISPPPYQIQSAGWHDGSPAFPFHSFLGIGGTFYWPEGGGGFITFTIAPGSTNFNVMGTYSLVRWFGASESGTFVAGGLPTSAAIILNPTTPAGIPRTYQVQGLFATDAADRIAYMLLRAMATGEFFVAFRLV